MKSLPDFIPGFLCNARNNSTQITCYLRQQSCIGLLSQDKLIGQPLKGEHFNGQAKRQSAAGLQVLCRTCTLSLHIKAPSFYSWPSYNEAVHPLIKSDSANESALPLYPFIPLATGVFFSMP